MKEKADVIYEDTWINSLTNEDIAELLGIDIDELDPIRCATPETCPSCDGECTIELEHSFYVDGKYTDHTYTVDCDYCGGAGEFSLNSQLEDRLSNLYKRIHKRDLARYNEVLNVGHI